jgi:2-dehydropantoate 2-reductase
MPARNTHSLFTIEGQCWRPRGFSQLDLESLHRYYQVEDMSSVDERLEGKAVRLRKLIDLAGPEHGTEYMTIESADGEYSVCLPMVETARTAVLIYEVGGKPIASEEGGPVRFVIPYGTDNCANVKSVGRIIISKQPGRDTRPSNLEQHDQLHAGTD